MRRALQGFTAAACVLLRLLGHTGVISACFGLVCWNQILPRRWILRLGPYGIGALVRVLYRMGFDVTGILRMSRGQRVRE